MDYAQQLAAFAHILEQKRLVTALEGNASVIDRQTGLTYVTPSGRMSFVTNRKFAPPVSSTFVLVAESRYIFSSNPFA